MRILEVVPEVAQERLVLGGDVLLPVDVEDVLLCHVNASLLVLGHDAPGVADDAARALGSAHATGDARGIVNDGVVVHHVDGACRAGPLACATGDAGELAHLAGNRALLGVGAARRDVEARVDHVDDVLRAGLGAQAAADAGVLVHVGNAPLVQADGPLAAGVDAGLAAMQEI